MATHGYSKPNLRLVPALEQPPRTAPVLRQAEAEPEHKAELASESFFEPRTESQIWSRSLIPAVALFGAVLAGRVLLSADPEPSPNRTAETARQENPAPAVVAAPEPVPSVAESATPSPVAGESASKRRATRPASRAVDTAPENRREAKSSINPTPASTRERTDVDDSGSTPTSAESVRPTKTAAPSSPGVLRINSRPWAEVFVDGERVGTTPQMALRLSPGQHSVELVNRELDMRKTILVDIESGQQVTKVVALVE